MQLIFLFADKHQGFLQIYTIILGVCGQVCQGTSFLFLCNILRRKWLIKLVFCMQISMKACDKLIESFWWGWSSIAKVSKITSLQCLDNILEKKLQMKLSFCMQINLKIFYKLISTLWVLKFPSKWYYRCWAWSSILKILKVLSLQYLYNISKKEVSNRVNFLHADRHQSFYKLALLFLMEVTKHVKSTQIWSW